MNDEEFNRLEQLIGTFKDEVKGELRNFKEGMTADFNNFKEETKGDFRSFKGEVNAESRSFREEIKGDLCKFKEDIKAEFRHQLGIQSEHFQHKLDIVVEGHEVFRKEIRDVREELCEKIKFVDFKLETMNKSLSEKIDAVAVDLKAHRSDTEVHRKVYKVKED